MRRAVAAVFLLAMVFGCARGVEGRACADDQETGCNDEPYRDELVSCAGDPGKKKWVVSGTCNHGCMDVSDTESKCRSSPAADGGSAVSDAGVSECCATCFNGKACGDACIHSTSLCTKAPGCACNSP